MIQRFTPVHDWGEWSMVRDMQGKYMLWDDYLISLERIAKHNEDLIAENVTLKAKTHDEAR